MVKCFNVFCGALFLILQISLGKAQVRFEEQLKLLPQIKLDSGVTLTFDAAELNKHKPTKIILYALPNGNTTAQTFGKKIIPGDDWHFDIQHSAAQTKFIRQVDPNNNYIVVYVENSLKSWPTWRRTYKKSDSLIQKTVELVYEKYQNLHPKITLTGHSGGGSFIFGYINSYAKLPNYVERIGFLDATYGYETEKHQQKLATWLEGKNKSLQVIAYNDSVVVFNGKPLVSPTGGTWYRSKLMAKEIARLRFEETADRLNWKNKQSTIAFILIKNPEAKIFHTVLVEKNGFIHLLFNGTKFAFRGYQFWGDRAYGNYILE